MALGGAGGGGGGPGPSDAAASGDPEVVLPYRSVGLWLTIQGRLGWLTFFFGGLILAAVVVEAFEEVRRSPPRPSSGPSGPAPRPHAQTHPPPARGAAGPGTGPCAAPAADVPGSRSGGADADPAPAGRATPPRQVLRKEVELSYFVPLLIGHGGNTGSQSVSTVIRALALGQVSVRDVSFVVAKEGLAGSIMGAALGTAIFAISLMWDGMSPGVGLCVAVSLPIVSLWANVLGAILPLAAASMGYNPAVTSAPLMTTIVDSSGLIIYFLIAKYLLGI